MSARYRVSDCVIGENLDGEAILLDTRSGQYYQLNRVATRMWEQLALRGDAEAVLEALLGEFEVAPDKLRADLGVFVDSLVQRGLLVPAGESCGR